MAPPNGIQSKAPGARKRLIQPVLPALPRPVRTKTKDEQVKPDKTSEETVAAEQAQALNYPAGQKDDNTHDEARHANIETPELPTQPANFENDTPISVFDGDYIETRGTPSVVSALPAELDFDRGSPDRFSANFSRQMSISHVDSPFQPDQNGTRVHHHVVDTTLPEASLENEMGHLDSYRHNEGISGERLTTAGVVHEPLQLGTPSSDAGEEEKVPYVSQSDATAETSPEVVQYLQKIETNSTQVQPLPEVLTNGHRATQSYGSGHMANGSMPVRHSSMPSILEYLLNLATTKQWADYVIHVASPVPGISPFVCYTHGFLLLRSERLKKMMDRPQEPSYPTNVVNIIPARILLPHAFEAALRFLYSDTVLSADALIPQNAPMDKAARAYVLDYILSYWTAGLELGLDPVVARAFNLLGAFLDWDLAEVAIKEANNLRFLSPPARLTTSPHELFLVANSIVALVFGLFIHRFDLPRFKLDTVSRSAVITPRLPQFEHSRTSSNNPALASMVFGSMPASSNLSEGPSTKSLAQISSSRDTVASMILLNLEFADLQVLTERMYQAYDSEGIRIISEAVEEREHRRLNILRNRTISNKQRLASPGQWEVVGWREYLDKNVLHRERVGFLIPTKR